MPYKRSSHRVDFDQRVDFLLKKARRAQRFRASDADIRDLVFQCTIFQTNAAMETYLRLLIESWAHEIRSHKRGKVTPTSTRAFLTLKNLEKPFAKYHFDGDEKVLAATLQRQSDLWPFMLGVDELPSLFSGVALHDKTAYPSAKNIRRLFARLGIDDMMGRLSKNLHRDVDILISDFQSVRTALAHSLPPSITILDVEKLLADAKALVGSIDRIFHKHVMTHGGPNCWY